MSFQLVFGDHEWSLPLNFDPHVEDLLVEILGRASYSDEQYEARCRDLSSRLVDAISAVIEHKVIPPTRKQIEYAVAIAQELSLDLPQTVLQFRDAMTAFLAEHANTYRRRKAL